MHTKSEVSNLEAQIEEIQLCSYFCSHFTLLLLRDVPRRGSSSDQNCLVFLLWTNELSGVIDSRGLGLHVEMLDMLVYIQHTVRMPQSDPTHTVNNLYSNA